MRLAATAGLLGCALGGAGSIVVDVFRSFLPPGARHGLAWSVPWPTLLFSLDGQVITAIPATLFAWIIGTGIAMLVAER